MILGAISHNSRTPLVVFRSTIAAQRYVDDILRPVLLPLLLKYPDFFFHQDNARPYTGVAMNYLTACQTLPWPARLRDLFPIEYV